MAGGQLDTLNPLRELIAATTTAQVAAGIIAFGVHDEDSIAALYHDLDGSAPGRFVLGLGGPQQERPLPALRNHLAALDAAGVPPYERLLAALGPKKTEIARDRTAGAITLLTTPESTAETRARLGTGPTLVVQQVAVLDEDPARARAAVHETIGFLARVAGYRANFRRMGYTDADADEVSDRLVDGTVVWGGPAAIAERVAQHREAGADQVCVSVFTSEGGPDKLTTAAAVAAELGLG